MLSVSPPSVLPASPVRGVCFSLLATSALFSLSCALSVLVFQKVSFSVLNLEAWVNHLVLSELWPLQQLINEFWCAWSNNEIIGFSLLIYIFLLILSFQILMKSTLKQRQLLFLVIPAIFPSVFVCFLVSVNFYYVMDWVHTHTDPGSIAKRLAFAGYGVCGGRGKLLWK